MTELVAAAAFDHGRLAEIFNAAYEGYLMPVHVDAAWVSLFVDSYDVDLARSRVACDGDDAVGIAFLGLRPPHGWLGALGVAAAARRGGVGRALLQGILDETRAAGLTELRLEVLEPNTAAIRLYEQAGFRTTRLVEVWSLDATAPASAAAAAPAERAHGWIRAHRRAREPWQRDDATVARTEDVEAVTLDERGAALFRVAAGRVSMLQLAADDADAARELLAAARARGDALRFLNVPVGDHASAALAQLGGKLDIRQLEMAIAL